MSLDCLNSDLSGCVRLMYSYLDSVLIGPMNFWSFGDMRKRLNAQVVLLVF